MIQIDAQKLLDEKLTAEQLFLYLRENMEDPSVDVYEDGYKNVTGFIACDIHGNIISTFNNHKAPIKFNSTKQAIIKHIQSSTNNSKTAYDNYELAQSWKEKAKNLEKTLYFTQIFSMIAIASLLCFGYHYHRQSNELHTLKSTIAKPVITEFTDTIN